MKTRKKLVPVTIFAAITGISAVIFFFGEYSVFRLMKVKGEMEAEKAQVEELKAKVEEQKKANELLISGDSLEMEKKAREKGMIKEGETIYIYEIEKEN